MTTDTPAAAPTAERRDSLIRFALLRFIAASYERANAAAQDKEGRWYKPGAAEAFLRDAKDAEAIRAALSAPVAAQPAASGVDALWVDEAMALLDGWQSCLGSRRASCFEGDKALWDRIDSLRTHLSTALTGKEEASNG